MLISISWLHLHQCARRINCYRTKDEVPAQVDIPTPHDRGDIELELSKDRSQDNEQLSPRQDNAQTTPRTATKRDEIALESGSVWSKPSLRFEDLRFGKYVSVEMDQIG